MKRDVKAVGRGLRMIVLKVTGVGTAALAGMSNQATLADNGTGDYTITFDEPFQVAPVIQITPITASISPRIKAVSTTLVTIECEDNDGTPTPTDADFHITIIGSDVADGFEYDK